MTGHRPEGDTFAPQPGSFLWAVAHAHPNARVTCGNVSGTAGSVARDIRARSAELDRLRDENASLAGILDKIVSATT